ncbi:MAG TPA: RluA family pseudouridine synthase [Verrucomicrobiae bacterium]|jgi:23S rRNA pseudouridine1911/1915/1917 synthase|nr:RluA family pseudouridine synthase [Verrucomicrobiae bacterium]
MKIMTVREDMELADFLLGSVEGANKTRVKQWLKFGSVSVNGRMTTQYRQRLKSGDKVSLLTRQERSSHVEPLWGLRMIYEDDFLVVVEKPPRLLTVATDKIQNRTAMAAVQDYLRQRAENQNARAAGKRGSARRVTGKQAFIVHRLDRDASGLLVFARTEDMKLALQGNWDQVEKFYYAVVEGAPARPAGTVESYLRENKILRVFSTTDKREGKLSVTHYETLEGSPRYTLLRVRLETGRKHQIRVHLSDLGTPIAGDKDYGARTDPAGRLALHAFKLAFRHPATGKPLAFETPLPDSFRRILAADARSS